TGVFHPICPMLSIEAEGSKGQLSSCNGRHPKRTLSAHLPLIPIRVFLTPELESSSHLSLSPVWDFPRRSNERWRRTQKRTPQRSRPCPFCSLWHDLSIAEDVSLDPDTAHPRLELCEDGKSVKDTGTIRKVPRNEKRFDSHLYVLAKEGYTSGRHYWEVDVGKRRSWALGIARESVTHKETSTLSPKNGFWVMGCTEGVGGKLPKIGIFLNISAKPLLLYNVHKKTALYTFTIADGSSQEEKFLPFFSTGSATAKPDTEPLKIVQGFDDDEQFTLHCEGLECTARDQMEM
uniref:B30.2/SPRY domain-containing protein n=1 Tax=Calidris pygmaea TaxID=425635 RepID=A0A8C3JC61_9CHAR